MNEKFYRVVGKVGSRYRTTLKHRSTLYFSSFPFSILRRERKKKREREREASSHTPIPRALLVPSSFKSCTTAPSPSRTSLRDRISSNITVMFKFTKFVRLIFEECLKNWRNFLSRRSFIYTKVRNLVTTIFESLTS